MAKKEIHVIILLVEGDTEVSFYNKVRELLLKNHQNSDSFKFLHPINIKGIGNYKTIAARQFDFAVTKFLKDNKPIKNHKLKKSEQKAPNTKFIFHAFMCIDTDVLDSAQKPARFRKNPPINENDTKQTIINKGGIPHFIKAVYSIEDWFLEDSKGIITYLKIDNIPKFKNNSSGAEKLADIFRCGQKVYTKGGKSEGFIECLDIEQILNNHLDDFKELLELLE
ncbi:hypothetical protein [Ruminococcus albus]|uniref:hypothetical protein n=1 Tax=Ruminococcus albus TaxID=1264 RepID=UPI0004646039|nr:hypothetical protein [Ruminococcus albus]